jgi:carbon monoxide dehydrogenase subunit G
MKIEDGFTVRAPRERVWAFIMDPNQLGPCIPGCTGIEVTGPDSYKAGIKVAIGPIKAEFKLDVLVEEQAPPNYLRSVTKGEEGSRASMLQARTLLELQEPEPGVTAVRYSTEVSIVGRLGKFGLGVMKKKAEGIGDDFVKTMRERLEPAA